MKRVIIMLLALCLLIGVGSAALADHLGEYPISPEKITLTGWAILGSQASISDLNENLAMQKLEEITNVHINWTCVTADGCEEKRSLMLAKNDLPQILFRCAMTNDEVSSLASTQQIYALDELMDHAPNFKALADRLNLWDAIRSADGHIYALPQIAIDTVTYHNVINMKWLEKVGLEYPKTLDDFYKVLVAFKEQDANGNGDPNDEIPFSVIGLDNLDYLLTAFGIFPASCNSHKMYVYPGESTVRYSYMEDGYKEALIFLNKLYKEGLLDSEFMVQNNAGLTAKGTSNRLGVLNTAGAFANVGNALHFDYRGLANFPDQKGNAYCANKNIAAGNQFLISKKCNQEEAVAAMRWVDYLYSEDGTILAWMGVEGKTWEWVDDKHTAWNWINADTENISRWRQNVAIQGGTGYPSAHPDLFESKMWSHQTNEIENSLDTKQFRRAQSDLQVETWPAMRISSDVLEELNFIMNDVKQYQTGMAADFITGVRDINAEWDSYVDRLKSMGIENAIAVYQKLYDDYKAKSK